MNKHEECIEALEASIDHWENIVDCTEYSDGTHNCALCSLYYGDNCEDCPIYKKTGQIFCSSSPFYDFEIYVKKTAYFGVAGKVAVCDFESKKLAEKMLEFLQMLLQKEIDSVTTYKCGDRFIHERDEEYILAHFTTNEVALISLNDGNRWVEPITVGNTCKITVEEFNLLTSGSLDFVKKGV